MNPLDVTATLAREQIRDRTEHARRSRLAALARCCRPSTWRRAIAHAVAAVRSRLDRSAPQPAACCG